MMRAEKLPVGAPEQAPPASARPLGAHAVLALQRTAGNQSVTRILAGARPPLARAPAAEATCNPWSAVHDLRRAIDQSEASDGWRPDDSGALRATTRKVDAALVISVLEGLAPAQIALVKSLYQAQEKTTLENDLFGSGQSEHASNLKPDQRARIEALLKGTADTQLEAVAVELHELVSGDLEEPQRERAMALLRRPADQIEAIDGHYLRLYHRHPNYDIALKLKGPQLERATALRAGDFAQADAHAIEDKRRVLAELQAKRDAGEESVPEALAYEHKRRHLIDGITATVQANRGDAMADPANVGSSADQAAQQRLAAVLATPVGPAGAKLEDELAFTLKGTEAAGIVVADRSLIETAARRLLELEARHTTDALGVAELLRGLRAQAEHDAIAAIPSLPAAKLRALTAKPPTLTKERLVAERAARYVEMFVATYNFLRLPHGRPWGAIVASASAANREMLDALTAGAGVLAAVDELRFAVQRKDAAAIEKVLRGQAAPAQLERDYDAKFAPETLRGALFGIGGADMAAGSYGPVTMLNGAVKGRHAALTEELLDALPANERDGPKEVDWIVERAEREIAVTEADSGAIGALRELGDDPETQRLMHESLAQLRMLRQQWHDQPKRRTEILAEMRQVRSAATGDASAYEDENAQLRAQVRGAVSFAVQVALAVALPGVGLSGFFSTTAANIGATVAANALIYGDDYDLAMVYRDVVGGGIGALGGKLGEDVAKLVAGEITEKVAETAARIAGDAGRAPKLAQELGQAAAEAAEARQSLRALVVAGAGEVGNVTVGTAASSVATGQDNLDFEGLLRAFLLNRLRGRRPGKGDEPPRPPWRPRGGAAANDNAAPLPEWMRRPAQNDDVEAEAATGTHGLPPAPPKRRFDVYDGGLPKTRAMVDDPPPGTTDPPAGGIVEPAGGDEPADPPDTEPPETSPEGEAPEPEEPAAPLTPVERLAAAADYLQWCVGRLRERLAAGHFQRSLTIAGGRTRGAIEQQMRALNDVEAGARQSAADADPETVTLAQAEVDAIQRMADALDARMNAVDTRTPNEVEAVKAAHWDADYETARDEAGREGEELADTYKDEGAGRGAGRSGGHGTPNRRAGAELIRRSKQWPEGDPRREAYRVVGEQLELRGNADDHPGKS